MFKEMPRNIGVPNQVWCVRQDIFWNFFKMFNGKAPFFVSPFRFTPDQHIIFDNLFFDIDSYMSLRFPLRNVRPLLQYFKRRNIPTIQNFSGQKGFHVFPIFKEQIIRTKASERKMSNLMYSVQTHIAKEIGLESYDAPTFGRMHFLMRFPTSKYVRANDEGELEWNGNYCVNLSFDELFQNEKYFSKRVQEPGTIPRKPKATMTLKQFSKTLSNFKLIERNNGFSNDYSSFTGNPGETIVPTVNALGIPCMKKLVDQDHPGHYERIELVCWLKQLNYSDLAICAFIKNCNWTRYNSKKTQYQVSKIKKRLPSCRFLKKLYSDACPSCTLYKR